MVLGDLRIELDSEVDSFFAGQSVTGRVVLEIREAKLIERLSIQCLGIGKVEWRSSAVSSQTPSSNGNLNNNRTRKGSWKRISLSKEEIDLQPPPPTNGIYSAQQIYIDTTLALLTNSNSDPATLEPSDPDRPNGNRFLVPIGTHSYPFEFLLPVTAPSSFQGPYGSIKYSLLATLARPRTRIHKAPHSLQIPFTVNGLLDLNKLNENSTCYGELSKFDNGKFVSCLPLRRNSSSKISGFHLKLERSAYVPGEYVQFRADIRNFKKVDVAAVVLSVIQETTYISNGVEKRGPGRETVCVARGPGVTAGTTEIWETNPVDSLFLQIPSVPPTNLALQSDYLIRIQYHLQLELDYYGMKNIKGSVPITIGTIPLISSFKDFIPPPIKPKLKKDVDSDQNKPTEKTSEEDAAKELDSKTRPSYTFGLGVGYPDLVSPSYEEAVACFTPTTLNYLLMKEQRSTNTLLTHPINLDATGKHSNGNKATSEDVDSDEEYILEKCSTKMQTTYDANYVPLYCKYVPSYGVDE